jgi:Ca2+-binding RTX toxin-like protein
VVETNANSSTGGSDLVCSTLAAYALGANVENGRVLATTAANLSGNSLNNLLYAGAGDNVLDGSTGTDTASYRYASAAVTLSLAAASAQATGGSGSDTLVAIENLTGSDYNDTLTGNAGANVLDGGAGADTLSGGDGSDTYYLRDAGDTVVEINAVASSGGYDTVYSYLAAYTLGANVENGRIDVATAANLGGNALNNVLYAGAGNNTLDGGAGADTASYTYASAAVTVSLAVAGAQATGGSGSDTLIGIENLSGSAYADHLSGNAGANILEGGLGADTLSGGAGNDSFRFTSALAADTITDFASGSDKLNVSRAGFAIGDGDSTVEGATVIAGPGGFGTSAELVVVTGNIAGAITAASAAAAIGSASAAYAVGQKALFVVDNGASSALWLFGALDADAQVESGELTLLASLTGTPALVTGDVVFGA